MVFILGLLLSELDSTAILQSLAEVNMSGDPLHVLMH
jgi:hypothetical protein